jgi:hypothetical protein
LILKIISSGGTRNNSLLAPVQSHGSLRRILLSIVEGRMERPMAFLNLGLMDLCAVIDPNGGFATFQRLDDRGRLTFTSTAGAPIFECILQQSGFFQ